MRIAMHTQTFTETMDSIKNESLQYGLAADTGCLWGCYERILRR